MAPSTPSKTSRDLLSVSFNQDGSCISVGSRKGYSIANVEPFGKVYSKADGPCSIVEMLFCTSLVAIVGTADSQPSSSPRKLKIVNTKRQSTICELVFPTAVLGVRLNRRRLIVILEEEIYIYDISNMKLLHTIETSPNPQAICALSPSSEPCYLAYPSPVPSPNSPFSSTSSQTSPGDVLIFDLLSLSVTNIIQAHKTPISSLSLNSNGSLLATASDKGTVIRIFSVPGAQKLYQFRRGTYNAKIYSIAFNAVSSLLAVSSDTETVHIFKLSPGGGNGTTSTGKGGRLSAPLNTGSPSLNSVESSENGSPTSNARGAGGYEAFIDDKKKSGSLGGSIRKRSMALGRNLSGSVGGYLPNSLAEMWEPSRDFAFLKLPSNGVSSVVAISNTMPQIMCVTSEGLFYSYNIDLESGGECTLMKQYSLLEGDDGANESSTGLSE